MGAVNWCAHARRFPQGQKKLLASFKAICIANLLSCEHIPLICLCDSVHDTSHILQAVSLIFHSFFLLLKHLLTDVW